MDADICPTVLWASATPIPDEHGKTPYMPLGINGVAGTDICHTRRRRRNLPHASDINSVIGAYNHLVPDGVGTRLSIRTLSLTCKAIPFIYKRGALSPKGENQSTTTRTTHTIRTTKDPNEQQTFEHLAHSGAPVTLGPSDQSPIGPFVPPIFLPSVCNPTANFEHLGLGIKSPTDSKWT